MIADIPYSYSILRYVHDVRTQEFLNIGVLVHALAGGSLLFASIEQDRRVKAVFPDVDSAELLATLGLLAAQVEAMTVPTIERACQALVARDDSSLRWSPPGAGLAVSLERALGSVAQRFLRRYERVASPGRSLTRMRRVRSPRAVLQALQRRLPAQLVGQLRADPITTGLEDYQFDWGWHHQRRHLLQAVSLDAHERGDLTRKARELAGSIQDLHRISSDAALHFVIGAPEPERCASVREAYHDALGFLGTCADERTQVLPESQSGVVLQEIESAFPSFFRGV